MAGDSASEDSLPARLRRRIRTDGPLAVSEYVEAALYDEDGGFYVQQGRAGRRGDFLTAPEVGPLFGAVVAAALDRWWRAAGAPQRFLVHEWGAGPGTLARAVVAAAPEVAVAEALRWVLIERSDRQRAAHPEFSTTVSVAAVDQLGAVDRIPSVVLANELLDNFAFEIVERRPNGWAMVMVAIDEAEDFVLLTSDIDDPTMLAALRPFEEAVPVGARVPWQGQARAWVRHAINSIGSGRVVVFDYGGPTATLAARDGGWLRTHRQHGPGGDWLVEPGSCDITADVATDQLQVGQPASVVSTQADWLRAHGIEELVDEGRRLWEASAGIGDLAALTGRSRVREAEALLDPAGMGEFVVLDWEIEDIDLPM